MNLKAALSLGRKAMADNSPVLLSITAVVGVVGTAYLIGRASWRAADKIDLEERRRLNLRNPMDLDDSPLLTPKEKVQLVWQEFVPGVTAGAFTVLSIVQSNRISNRRANAMAAAYGITERAFVDYRKAVVNKIGEKKEHLIRSEVAQAQAATTTNDTNIFLDEHQYLCFDQFTGRYFRSTVEAINKAENAINHQILNEGYASVSDFHSLIGLAGTAAGEEVGWTLEDKCELRITSMVSSSGRPAISVEFSVQPVRKYWQFNC